ncbi:hypothetical protein ACSBR2_024649 [Camellia fascicularis]
MAVSSTSLGLQYHVRSISLPARLHTHFTKIEVELNKLKTWESSLVGMVPLSAETIRVGLVGLAKLYNCVEQLIPSPVIQHALLQHRNGVLVEEALEGSVILMDSCSVAQNLFLMMKEHVQDLQSALRRKGGDISIESNINAYMCCKKKVNKESIKHLGVLKQMERKIVRSSSYPLLHVNHYLSMVIRVLREATSITISVLRTLWLFFSVSASKTKPSGWSLASRLLLTRPVASERGNKILNEVGNVDSTLQSLHRCIRSNDVKGDVQMARKRLQALDASIEGLEAGLDCLFRRQIQNRVSLLNILAH